MTLIIILASVIVILYSLVITLDNEKYMKIRYYCSILGVIASIVLMFYGIIITRNRMNKEELNKYIKKIENYQEIKSNGKIENQTLIFKKKEWCKKIENYKNKFDIFVPDKKLNEALELKEEVSE